MIDLLCQLPSGTVKRVDIIDLMGERVRQTDPATFTHGYRVMSDKLLRYGEWPELHRLLGMVPKRYVDLFKWLRIDGDKMAVPVGFDHLAMFCMMFGFDSGPVVFQTANVQLSTNNATTVPWVKPALPRRWANITLIGCGGGGGGGARTTTASNNAAGGGGGGGGGLITRMTLLSGLSSGDMVLGTRGAAGSNQTGADAAGNNGSAGGDVTFGGLTAAGGGAGTGGGMGAGAQTGAGGTGGTGDVAGRTGGTGRSGATTAGDGGDSTAGEGSAGGGGGGATADSAQGDAGRGGHCFTTGTGGGIAGTVASRTGGLPTHAGAAGGGGAGANASSTSGGAGASGALVLAGGGFGAGGGGGGGRARNAAAQTGIGQAGGVGSVGFAAIISF